VSAPTVDLTAFDELAGVHALPRSNGELIFDAPWQGRLFGLVVHLCQAGTFEWDAFKTHLIAVIAESGVNETCDPGVYYRQFGEAFCRLADQLNLFDSAAVEQRASIEARHLAHDDHDHQH